MNQVLLELSKFEIFSWLRGEQAWLLYALGFLFAAGLCLAWYSVMSVIWTYGERKIAAFIQGRIGPNRVGPWGILQPIADGIKLFAKEDIRPKIASPFLFFLAPVLVFVGAFLPFVALPFSGKLFVSDMALGLYYIIGFEALEVIGVLMAGWAPGSKWSLYGGMRLAAQMLSYEIPMGLCIAVIVLLSGSLNLLEIVNWQASGVMGLSQPLVLGWAVFRSPVVLPAFIIFYICALAASKRAPFDLPEAESELVAGYHTEYSGMRFAFFFMAEYASMYVLCALAAILFLGGWHGPIPTLSQSSELSLTTQWASVVSQSVVDGSSIFSGFFVAAYELFFNPDSLSVLVNQMIGFFNLLLKSFGLYFVMIWLRWTLPRMRIDDVMYLCLKVLLPFGLGCLVIAVIQVAIWP